MGSLGNIDEGRRARWKMGIFDVSILLYHDTVLPSLSTSKEYSGLCFHGDWLTTKLLKLPEAEIVH